MLAIYYKRMSLAIIAANFGRADVVMCMHSLTI